MNRRYDDLTIGRILFRALVFAAAILLVVALAP